MHPEGVKFYHRKGTSAQSPVMAALKLKLPWNSQPRGGTKIRS